MKGYFLVYVDGQQVSKIAGAIDDPPKVGMYFYPEPDEENTQKIEWDEAEWVTPKAPEIKFNAVYTRRSK